MDDGRFDLWTRALSHPRTRRAALRAFTSGSLSCLGWLRRVNDAAACRKSGKKCKKDKQCCTKQCKRKKCRCTPLQGRCPGELSSHVCCPHAGASPFCLFSTKPQCGPSEYQCLLQLHDPCTADCDCIFDQVCAGAPPAHCCWAPGRGCGNETLGANCCSEHCGCDSSAGPCYCRNDGCKNPGAACSSSIQCCNGICESGKCCLSQGIACTATAQCCAGLFCNAGLCKTP